METENRLMQRDSLSAHGHSFAIPILNGKRRTRFYWHRQFGFRRQVRGGIHRQRIQQVHDAEDKERRPEGLRLLQMRRAEFARGNGRCHQTRRWVDVQRHQSAALNISRCATSGQSTIRWRARYGRAPKRIGVHERRNGRAYACITSRRFI